MTDIPINEITNGMVLDADVRDINNRLLLSRGTELDNRHIRILKMWGVPEIAIAGPAAEEARSVFPPGSGDSGITDAELAELFRYNDTRHPFIQTLMHTTRRCRAAGTGRPLFRGGPPDPDQPPSDELLADFDRHIDQNRIRLPEMPTIITELNEIISDPFASSSQIAAVVSKSPSLAALLLKIVNSALYGFPSRIDSISRAAVIIGSKEITQLAIGISTIAIVKGMPPQIIDVPGFIKHSLGCAIFSRVLGTHCNVPQTEQLFVAGLLHDIGRAVLLQHFPDHARGLYHAPRPADTTLCQVERTRMGTTHARLGGELLRRWRLPLAIVNMVACHHHPSLSDDILKSTIVHLADVLANAFGLGASAEGGVPPVEVTACSRLHINENSLALLVQQVMHQLNHLINQIQDQI